MNNYSIEQIRAMVADIKQNIHAQVVEFLKGINLNDYPCDIFLGDLEPENRATELILDYDREMVEVVYGYCGDVSVELGDLSVDEQIAILEGIKMS